MICDAAMQRSLQNSPRSLRAQPPLVSNRLGEPMALFAVPLPSSSSKSDFLCLCKRLFWSVGTSYFSAFCPLTAEETRLLPHSSAVVQLVSVTPALAVGNHGKQPVKQDLLAYTLSGDMVGIPYVAISIRHNQPNGKLTKTFPFDDLASSAWVPAINAPFVGCTAEDIGIGPKKDVFVIKNDEKTRESLMKGESVTFSRPDDRNGNTKEPGNMSVPVAQPQHDIPRKESPRQTGVSPTSSSLYKLYNSSKTETENGPPKSPTATGMKAKARDSVSAAPKTSSNEQPAMVLPRIEAVFSLAGCSSPGKSLSKKIADTIANRSASLQKGQAMNMSNSVDSHCDSALKDALPQQVDGSLPKPQLGNFQKTSPTGATNASELVDSPSVNFHILASKSKAVSCNSPQSSAANSSELTRRSADVPLSQSIPKYQTIIHVKSDKAAQLKERPITLKGSSEKTPKRPDDQTRCTRRVSCLTVKQILMSRRKSTSPLNVSQCNGVPAGAEAVCCPKAAYSNGAADANDTQSYSTIGESAESFADARGVPLGGVNCCDAISPCGGSERGEVSPLKMVIKIRPSNDKKVTSVCHPVKERLVVLDDKVPCLKLHKLDISLYSFADPGVILESESESKENAFLHVAHRGTSGNNTAAFQNGEKCNIQPEARIGVVGQFTKTLDVEGKANAIPIRIPENIEGMASVMNESGPNGKQKKTRKRRRKLRFTIRPTKRYKASHNHERSTIQEMLEGNIDKIRPEKREHLSDCQNTLPRRCKQDVPGDLSFNDSYFQGAPANQEPAKPHATVQYLQDQTEGSGKKVAVDLSDKAPSLYESYEDIWSDGANSSGSEWECPDKTSADNDSDWDSSLEDEAPNSPAKYAQPIKTSPFGDFEHMLLQDRLRLLEQTLKEHQSALNAIKRPQGTPNL